MGRNFDGVDDYYKDSWALLSGPPFTVAGWINTHDPGPVDDGVFWYQGDGTWAWRWKLQIEGSTPGSRGALRFVSEGPGMNRGIAETAPEIVANKWQHVAGVEYASNSRKAFLDYVYQATNTTNTNPQGSPHNMTSFAAQAGTPLQDFYIGCLAHWAMWDVALTDREIAALAAGFSPLSIRRDSMLAYWPMNGTDPESDYLLGYPLTRYNAPLSIGEPPIIYHTICPP
jgi:hypothetical protein